MCLLYDVVKFKKLINCRFQIQLFKCTDNIIISEEFNDPFENKTIIIINLINMYSYIVQIE